MAWKAGDYGRIAKDDPHHNPSSMVRAFRGQDVKVLGVDEGNGLIVIEVDQPPALGGAPRFQVRPTMLEEDVTPAMIRAGLKAAAESPLGETAVASIYRAMQRSRFT